MEAPAAAVGDAADLLHVDVDQLAWAIALVAVDGRGVRRPITTIEAAAARGVEDPLHRRGGEAGLVREVIRAPAMFAA